MKKEDFDYCTHGNFQGFCRLCERDRQIASLEGKVSEQDDLIKRLANEVEALEKELTGSNEWLNELRADHDEERRKMAWQLVVAATRSGINPSNEWPSTKAWEVVDTFLAAEKEDGVYNVFMENPESEDITQEDEMTRCLLEHVVQSPKPDSIEAVKARIEEFKKTEAKKEDQ